MNSYALNEIIEFGAFILQQPASPRRNSLISLNLLHLGIHKSKLGIVGDSGFPYAWRSTFEEKK